MVLETDPVVFANWIGPALVTFLWTVAALGLAALVFSYLAAAYRHGPLEGGDVVFSVIKTGFLELAQLSPRRIAALARLGLKEALRRRVFAAAFALYLVVLLFAGWYLERSAPLVISFVMGWTTFLVLATSLFVGAFSLPADIKNKTVYTIVTKPVRPGEIVLGRILGFALVGTVLLVLMGLSSYVFVRRTLDHVHIIDPARLERDTAGGLLRGYTSLEAGHQHTVTVDAVGRASLGTAAGHTHELSVGGDAEQPTYQVGAPEGLLSARVPIYAADLRFKNRDGADGQRKGISVGSEWTYRSYIDGATPAAAIWTFTGLSREQFPKGLPIEMIVRVFRSWKGTAEQIDKGVRGSLILRNPQTDRKSIEPFRAKDNTIDRHFIPVKLEDSLGAEVDLFGDLVSSDGTLEIWVQCDDSGHYFGMAKADMFLRSRDASFALNFMKGYVGVWLQMIVVTSLAVVFSTFLNGAVAMLATVTMLVLGFFTGFVVELATGKAKGGGPIESLVRVISQRNMVTELEPGLTRSVIETLDAVLLKGLTSVVNVLPNFREFSNTAHVAHGFDVPLDAVLVQGAIALAFLAGSFVVGYFLLKTREVAA